MPIITHETLHNVLEKTEPEIFETRKGFAGRVFETERFVSSDLDNLMARVAGEETITRGLKSLIGETTSPAAVKEARETLKPIIQDVIRSDLQIIENSILRQNKKVTDEFASLPLQIKRTTKLGTSPSIAKAQESISIRQKKLSEQSSPEIIAAENVGRSITSPSGTGSQPSFSGSKSLLKNLDKLGSITGDKPAKTSLGILGKQPPIPVPSLATTSKPQEKSPAAINVPSIATTTVPFLNDLTVTSPPSPATPTGSGPSPPSTPTPKTPTPKTPTTAIPKGPSGRTASLVIGRSTPKKPPFVAQPPFLIDLALKESRKGKKLPTFSKQLTFIADPADPLRAGVFAAKGVPQLVSGKAKIFKEIDKRLDVARRAKGAFVPLGESIGIERAGIGLGPRKKPKKRKSSKRKR